MLETVHNTPTSNAVPLRDADCSAIGLAKLQKFPDVQQTQSAIKLSNSAILAGYIPKSICKTIIVMLTSNSQTNKPDIHIDTTSYVNIQ